MSTPLVTRASLLLRIRDPQDRLAWGEFVALYAPLVYAYGRHRGLQDSDAADLIQEVFHRVARSVAGFEYDPARGSFRGWLLTVTRNEVRKLAARRVREAGGTGDSDVRQFLEQQPDARDEEAWRRDYQWNLFQWAADRVRVEFRDSTWQAFWRTAVLAEDVDQVARELNLSPGAVYVARSRVTARIRRGDPGRRGRVTMTAPTQCPDRAEIEGLVAGRLPPDRVAALERHLDDCATCRRHLDEASGLGAILPAGPGPAQRQPPSDALRRVMDGLQPPPHSPARSVDPLPFLQPTDRPGFLGRLGPYEIRREIGRGGMGVVFEGFDPALNRTVAVKVLSPLATADDAARDRFRREAQAAAALEHEHIVTVHAVDQVGGLPYMVMQYVAGESLADRLDREGRLPFADVVRLGAQVARGLAAAHAAGAGAPRHQARQHPPGGRQRAGPRSPTSGWRRRSATGL